MQPAIIIPAYNRPQALLRLLRSLAQADYPSGESVPLVFSIDQGPGGTHPEVRAVAEAFAWPHGPKQVIAHTTHLGLLRNFFFCGDLTARYGSAILLEDDLLVSPAFYLYAQQGLKFYAGHPRIAGLSLFRYPRNGYTHQPFEPLPDAGDVFFMQLPSIQGQVWSEAGWEAFARWYRDGSRVGGEALHEVWSTFDTEEYFPVLVRYLTAGNHVLVFPRTSLTTGFGDMGTHFARRVDYFQVPLQHRQTDFRFLPLEEALAIYDSFMELIPASFKRLVPGLRAYDFDVDLNASKRPELLQASHVLTTRTVRSAVQTFALAMRPMEANVLHEMAGDGIALARRADLRWDRRATWETQLRLRAYAHTEPRPGLRQLLANLLLDLLRWRA